VLQQDEKREEWLSKYIQILENSGTTTTSTTSGTTSSNWSSPFLLPIAMKVAAQTISGGHLNEEKYTNERRKTILDDILEGRETDYDKLDEMKKEFMIDGLVSISPMSVPIGKIFYMDYVYGKEKWYTKIFKKIKKFFSKNKNSLNDFISKRYNR